MIGSCIRRKRFLLLVTLMTSGVGLVVLVDFSSSNYENTYSQNLLKRYENTNGMIDNIKPTIHSEMPAVRLEKIVIKLPDISDVLIHLKSKSNVFEPEKKISKDRQNVTFVIGIPHVKRHKASYLNDSLSSLIDNLGDKEEKECLIIVMFCDLDHAYNLKAVEDIAAVFSPAVNSGLLELIVTPPSFYPALDKVSLTVNRNGDSRDRWKWRSKENLDAAYLMNYAYPKGRFYMMTEDDVTAVPGYMSEVKTFTLNPPRQNWFYLGFTKYGSIGVLVRSRDCPMLVNFILNFYYAWPVDWLLNDFVMILGCKKDTDPSCGRQKDTLRLNYKRELFKHIGYHSSLKGQIRKIN